MNNSTQSQGSLWYVIGISLVAALGGFLFGFDMIVVSGTIKSITAPFHLEGLWKGWATSCCIFACIPGAAFAGKLADTLGRKKVLIGTAVLFAVSAVGAGWSHTLAEFSLYRILGGLAIGAASGVAPIYIAETAPTRLRGRFVSFYQLAIVTGLSAAYYSNYFLATATGAEAWRWMLTAGVVPAALFLGFLFLVPETPRWLAKQGRKDEALAVLARVDGGDYARSEIAVILETLQVPRGSLRDLLEPRMLKIVVIGSLLGIFSQISGVNAISMYAPEIFEQAGAGAKDSLFNSSLIGLTFIVFTFIPIAFVERFGRRPILMVGVGIMAAALMALTALMSDPAGHGLLLTALILVYIAAYASSIACLTWVILSEIFPNRIRGEAMSVANLCLWTANSLLILTFPVIQDHFGRAAPFAVYAGTCMVIVLFVWKFIPETKGKSLEEIEIQLVGLPSTLLPENTHAIRTH